VTDPTDQLTPLDYTDKLASHDYHMECAKAFRREGQRLIEIAMLECAEADLLEAIMMRKADAKTLTAQQYNERAMGVRG